MNTLAMTDAERIRALEAALYLAVAHLDDSLVDVRKAINNALRVTPSEPAPPTDGPTEDDDPSEWDHGQLLREVHELHREARLYSETLDALRDRVRVLTNLVRKLRKFVPFEPWPDLTAEIDRALATTQEPLAKEPTHGQPRLCPGCRALDGEHDFGETCTLREGAEP